MNGKAPGALFPLRSIDQHAGKSPGRKILLPNFQVGFRTRGNTELQEHEFGFGRGIDQSHPGLLEGLIALFQITRFAGHYHIGPVGLPPAGFGAHMINGEDMIGNSAILAGIFISPQNIFFAESDPFFTIPPHHFQYPDDGRELKSQGGGTHHESVAFQVFRAAVQYHDNGAFGGAELQGFIGIIENQNFYGIQHKAATHPGGSVRKTVPFPDHSPDKRLETGNSPFSKSTSPNYLNQNIRMV